MRFWLVKRDRAALLFVCVAGIITTISYSWRRRNWHALWPLAAASAGLTFLAFDAPNPRFGLGYFVLPAAAALSLIFPLKIGGRMRRIPALPLIVSVILCAVLYQDRSRVRYDSISAVRGKWLLPAKLPNADGATVHVFNQAMDEWTTVKTRSDQVAGFRFLTPASTYQCWDYQPCSPGILDRNIELRDPARGLASGFHAAAD